MRSYLSHLECTACGKAFPAEELHTVCPACGKVLYPRYDLEAVRRSVTPRKLSHRVSSMWRFFEVLPVRDPANVVTLGEGETPLLPAPRLGKALGCAHLSIKDEGVNPTATFKARGMAAAVSRAKELGARGLAVPSAGNAAGALAAYAARAGLDAHVFMPQETPAANKKECLVCGARLELVPGHIGDAGRAARERVKQEGLFDVSTLKEPYRVEGKKIMAYELAEALGWRLPDTIVYPTGGGTGIVGMWKAFEEMEALGWLREDRRPRLVCVQAEGCAPVVKAFQQGKGVCEPWQEARTVAAGLRVPAPFADYLILQALRDSGGTAVTVSDAEILDALREMASVEGIFACPEGAATLAGLRRALSAGLVDPGGVIVLLNTGSGLKYLELVREG
ncbi:MAG: threonine synthase [Chloroflexi bacterium]|nr:threonine synthase [Chloroflexota bacterium]